MLAEFIDPAILGFILIGVMLFSIFVGFPISFTLIFLGAENSDEKTGLLELTYNWDPEEYTGGRNFGHLAYSVKNIYDTCDKLMKGDVIINRPPRDGHMAFVRSPDGISIEVLQEGDALPPQEPWQSMKNIGTW